VRLGGLSQPERFRFWLLRIVANEAISRRRALRRRAVVTKLFLTHKVENRSAEPRESDDAADLQSAVERAMRQLPDKEARAIALFGLDDLPHEQVGRIMGCSAGVVRWHVHQARKKLRVLLREYLE
jgi:RNA polymerase sigma-70 factor (ECF subfamily)